MPLSTGKFTYSEIKSQGSVWKQVIAGFNQKDERLTSWLNQKHDEVIFTGCGSTHYLSLAAARNWTALTREPSRGLPGSELWYYPEANYTTQKPMLIGVSRSGETTETIHAIEEYERRYSDDYLVIGCYPDSAMMKQAPLTLCMENAQEESVAQTRSFSSMYLMTLLLTGMYAKNQKLLGELKQVPEAFDKAVETYEAKIKSVAEDKNYQHFVYLGSSSYYGLASETMLKMKEMSTSISEVFHFMEYRHGPMSMITRNSLVIGMLSDGRKEEEVKVLRDMKNLGATTLALTRSAEGVEADIILEVGKDLGDFARGMLYLPLMQLLGYYHSLSKGLNPDNPTNLTAVVHL